MTTRKLTARQKLSRARPAGVYLLLLLLLILGVSAVYGGYSLMTDPLGRTFMPRSWLETTPFSSYFSPGLMLFTVLGIFPILTALALWLRPTWKAVAGLERLTHKHWSWSASLTSGFVLVIWIVVQFLLLGAKDPVQLGLEAFCTALGVGIVLVSWLPSVRQYYALKERER